MLSESMDAVEEFEVAAGSVVKADPSNAVQIELPDKPVVANDANDALVAFSFRELWEYRELLYFLTWRDIKVRYKQTAMGAVWAIIQPLFMVIIFAVFFGIFMRVPTDGMPFLFFFYCGLLPWTFFSNAISNSSMSLVGNSNLITKIYFPRVIIPIATIGAGFLDLLIASVILVGLVIYYSFPLTQNILLLPLLILLTILLASGLGMWLAALTVKYRDVRHALPFTLQLWMFLTPIVYPLSIIPEKWHWAMFINPLTGIVEGVRASFTGHSINWIALLASTVVTVLILVFSVYEFRRIERSFADHI